VPEAGKDEKESESKSQADEQAAEDVVRPH